MYYVTSVLFPAHDAYVDRLISADDALLVGTMIRGTDQSPSASVTAEKHLEKEQSVAMEAETGHHK